MKTIGLLGGTGWVSTVEYYRVINETVSRRLGGLNAARCILYSVNFAELDALKQKGDNEESVFQYFRSITMKLVNAGTECILLCANTAHIHAERLAEILPVPLLHIADALADRMKIQKIGRVGLLGTRQTMEMDFCTSRLNREGMEVMVPEKEDRDWIQNKIWSELLRGIFTSETKQRFLRIIEGMKSSGIKAVVLGCTEIPLIIGQKDLDLPVFNTLKIHAEAAVDFALSNGPGSALGD